MGPALPLWVLVLPLCSALAKAHTGVSNFPLLSAFVLHRLNPVFFLPSYLLGLFVLLQLLAVPQPLASTGVSLFPPSLASPLSPLPFGLLCAAAAPHSAAGRL